METIMKTYKFSSIKFKLLNKKHIHNYKYITKDQHNKIRKEIDKIIMDSIHKQSTKNSIQSFIKIYSINDIINDTIHPIYDLIDYIVLNIIKTQIN